MKVSEFLEKTKELNSIVISKKVYYGKDDVVLFL